MDVYVQLVLFDVPIDVDIFVNEDNFDLLYHRRRQTETFSVYLLTFFFF